MLARSPFPASLLFQFWNRCRGHDSATRFLSGVIICPGTNGTAVIGRTPSPLTHIILQRNPKSTSPQSLTSCKSISRICSPFNRNSKSETSARELSISDQDVRSPNSCGRVGVRDATARSAYRSGQEARSKIAATPQSEVNILGPEWATSGTNHIRWFQADGWRL
jgi:hypothetical protein